MSTQTNHLNNEQLRALSVLTTAIAPLHNLYRANERRHDHGIEPCGATGVKVKLKHRSLSTYDMDHLTQLVIEAHRRHCRVDISPARGFQLLEVTVHARSADGDTYLRHPGLEDLKLRVEKVCTESSSPV